MTVSPIRQYRQTHSMTLAQLASRFGVDTATVSRWETRGVPAERIIEIERITGVPRHALRPDLYPPVPGDAA